jgi:hypothetical protein
LPATKVPENAGHLVLLSFGPRGFLYVAVAAAQEDVDKAPPRAAPLAMTIVC